MNALDQIARGISKYVRIPVADAFLLADLEVPVRSPALVLFAHDGRCRNHPRHQHVAQVMYEKGIGTLLCDLLTDEEAAQDEVTAGYRNDANLLARRLLGVTQWVTTNPETKSLRIGYFGACAGGAAAVIAAARMCNKVGAVVVRDGRLDLAAEWVARVTAPTLLIEGENDGSGIELNRQALPQLACQSELRLVSGASHLFGEPGALKAMARLSADWFCQHLKDPLSLV